MTAGGRPAAHLLRQVLDMFLDSPVAVVGCHSRGIQRGTCELDVVVISNESRPPTSLSIEGTKVDLAFMTEREALKPTNPEHAVSMALAKPVRDTSLLLSTSSAASTAVLAEEFSRASTTRLASALKTLGRATESLSAGSLREADFWLVAASYEFAYAWAYSREVVPSPSHLLEQLRPISKGWPKYFEAVTRGAGLEKGTRAGCGARMEGLEVLHDLARSSQKGTSWSDTKLEIVRGKAEEIASRIELAECYSYVGQEVVDCVMSLSQSGGGGRGPSVSGLFGGPTPLLGDRLLRTLGVSRTKQTVGAAMDTLRGEVSGLAKRV